MQIRSLIALCCVSIWTQVAEGAEGDNEVKRGVFPFMAFLYYPDETVVDTTGARFLRTGVLIKPEWLISSAIDHSVLDNIPLGFPRKTLLARLGAIAIDTNFTLNEDEDEQEREIIQIVRPSIHNVDVWWFTDITVLKTLLPFNMTSAVTLTTINPRRDYIDKNCIILVYTKRYANLTEERVLMQLSVELLPANIENCGNQFSKTSMTCAADSDETKGSVNDPEFCQGNSGGPLMCEGEVMGLQTYIENNCKPPHLYQLLTSSESLITCAIQENCHQEFCSNICTATNKDAPITERTVSPTHPITDPPPVVTELTELSEFATDSTVPSTSDMSSDEPETTTSSTMETTEPQTTSTTTITTTPTTTTAEITTESTTTTTESAPFEKPWPSEKHKDNLRKMDHSEETETVPDRQASMEAQQQQVATPRAYGAAERNKCLIQSLVLGFSVLAYVI